MKDESVREYVHIACIMCTGEVQKDMLEMLDVVKLLDSMPQ
jgi:hypothetical protein